MLASNPAARSFDSSTRFRVKTWRGIEVEGGKLNEGEEFPRGNTSDQNLVAMMVMGQIEPFTPTDQSASAAAVQGIEPGDDYDDYPDEDEEEEEDPVEEEDHAANKPARKPAPPKRGRKPAKR